MAQEQKIPQVAGTELQAPVGSTVQHFVENFISQAEDGLKNKGYSPCKEDEKHIVIELNATEQQEVGGGFKIHILSLGGKTSDTNVQKMTIFAKKIDEADEVEKKARIAKAEAAILQAKAEEKLMQEMGGLPTRLV